MALQIYEILDKAGKAKAKKDKIDILKKNESWALKDVLRGAMDATVQWNLPVGAPPYTAAPEHSAPTSLLRENTKFAYLVKGGKGDQLPAFKRERIFIGILEGIDPSDAEVLIKVINKESFNGITRPVVNEAFPGLLKD